MSSNGHLPEQDRDTVDVYGGSDRPVAVPAEIVLKASREYRCFTMHQQGTSWAEIAEIEGYANAAAASSAVSRYIREGQILVNDWTRQEMLAIVLSRLDYILAQCWPGVETGKLPAMKMALETIDRQVKYQRLDEDTGQGGARTVIVMGSTEDYQGTLERLTSGD